jgi:class 3 adenylate cyclase
VASQTPEETIELLNAYYTLMFEAINAQGGVVNQMVGDGLMAIFGAPLPLDDAAGAAVRAAEDMVALLAQFSDEREVAGKPALRIGVGIASGEVVAGYTGTQQRATYTCVGDTVNLAARLESHTKETGRTILIDGETYRALRSDTPAESMGRLTLRGTPRPVDVYAIVGVDSAGPA